MNAHNSVSRRALLTGGLATGFLLAFHLPLRAAVNEPEQPKDTTDGKFAPNAFIRIDETGQTTLIMPQVEMGQGIYTSISMILAEELDADWAKVAAAARAAKRQALRQSRLRHCRRPVARRRSARAGSRCAKPAPARARCWCRPRPRNGRSSPRVARRRRARSSTRQAAASSAMASSRWPHSSQTPPKDVPLKDPKDFVLIGQPLKRLDTPDKVNGKAVYGIDAILPDMKFAAIANCPVFGGKVGKVDDSAAKKVAGRAQGRRARRRSSP